jgi:hypothetical protein
MDASAAQATPNTWRILIDRPRHCFAAPQCNFAGDGILKGYLVVNIWLRRGIMVCSRTAIFGEVVNLQRIGRHQGWRILAFVLLLPSLFLGCASQSLPQFDTPTKSDDNSAGVVVVAPSNGATVQALQLQTAGQPVTVAPLAAVPSAATPDQITGFRGPTVILYSSERSNEGEKVPASSLPLPLRSRAASPGSPRVEIMTVYGPRWIAKSDVVGASVAPSAIINR